jgi:hypothetical protein
MLSTVTLTSLAVTRQCLCWTATRSVVIEAIELQDADSSALCLIVICPKGSQSLGALLKGGPTSIPGGQLSWTGEILLNPDEEIRGYVDSSTIGDRLFLTVKAR